MQSERGYTLVEVLIVVGMIGVLSAVALPVFVSSNAMNALWTNSEQLGALIRQTRLRAIARNTTFEVRFNCPAAGNARGLIMTGDPDIDDIGSRCSTTTEGDSEVIVMTPGVAYDADGSTGLQVTGRGVFTAEGDGASIPLTISVSHGSRNRFLRVSATGQITFSDVEPDDEE